MLKKYKTLLIQIALFIVTVLTTTLAGAEWIGIIEEDNWKTISNGFLFSIPFLGILTVHEFGHYITARLYKVKVTLPYYIPFYFPFLQTIGTMGAFIRIKSPLKSKREIFDIGVAGPLAGFIVALGVLWYGFTHLPAKEHIYKVHPQYEVYGPDYEKHVYTYEFAKQMDSIQIAKERQVNPNGVYKWPQPEYPALALDKNLLILVFEKYVVSDPTLIPNKYELFHYPFIFAGFLALFFTALNLLPIGQLDGGHITFGLLGTKGHKYLSSIIFTLLVYLSGIGVFKNNPIGNVFASLENLLIFAPVYLYLLYFIFGKFTEQWKNNLMVASCVFAAQFFTEFIFPSFEGIGLLYLVFSILVGRFLGIHHPPAYIEEPLDLKRKIIGWLSLVIFVLCFTPQLFTLETLRP